MNSFFVTFVNLFSRNNRLATAIVALVILATGYGISRQPIASEPDSPRRTKSWWSLFLTSPLRLYQAKKQRAVDRAALRHLMKLEEHQLKDIGISRSDIQWASKQRYPSLELENIARKRQKHIEA